MEPKLPTACSKPYYFYVHHCLNLLLFLSAVASELLFLQKMQQSLFSFTRTLKWTSLGFWEPCDTAPKGLEMCDFQAIAFIKSCQVPLELLKLLLPGHALQNTLKETCHYHFTYLNILTKGNAI